MKEGVTAVLVDVVVRDRRGPAGQGSDAGRLRDPRRRRGADDRLVHADPRECVGEHGGTRGGTSSTGRQCRRARVRGGDCGGPRRHRDRVPRPEPRDPEARRGVGAGLPRTKGRDVELRRHLRDRPLADASRAFHPQRLCGPPGAEPYGDGGQCRVQCSGNAAAARRRRECGGFRDRRRQQRDGRGGRRKQRQCRHWRR